MKIEACVCIVANDLTFLLTIASCRTLKDLIQCNAGVTPAFGTYNVAQVNIVPTLMQLLIRLLFLL